MNITMIAAVGQNLELGRKQNLIWRFKEDMKFFKEHTIHKKVIMGLNTFYSLPRALPERENIVISADDVALPQGVIEVHSLPDAIMRVNEDEEAMIIGGASIYRQFMPYATRLLLTEIQATCDDADVYFPEFNKSEWIRTVLSNGEQDGIKYEHVQYDKIRK